MKNILPQNESDCVGEGVELCPLTHAPANILIDGFAQQRISEGDSVSGDAVHSATARSVGVVRGSHFGSRPVGDASRSFGNGS